MDAPIVRALDPTMEMKALYDDFISLRYNVPFCGVGEVVLVLPGDAAAQPETEDYLLCGNNSLYVVDKITHDTQRGEITVHGLGALSMLSRCVIEAEIYQRRSIEREVNILVRDYAPSVFPASVNIASPQMSGSTELVIAPGNLYDRIISLVASVRKGVTFVWNHTLGRFEFAIPRDVDRTLGNTAGNEGVLLSEGFGTVGSVFETVDKTRYINRVIVDGATQPNGTPYTVTVNAGDYVFPDGFDDSAEAVREKYVKSGIGVSAFTSVDAGGNTVFNSTGYLDALRERGRQELALHRAERKIKVTLFDDACVDIGDICTLSTPICDVTRVRVTDKEYEYTKDGCRCTAELDALG